MSDEILGPDLIEIFRALTEIPLSCNDPNDALKRIIELCREALGSDACTLALLDLEERVLTHVAVAGLDEEFNRYLVGRTIKLRPPEASSFLDPSLVEKGEVIECYGLQHDGQGVANSVVALKYKLRSVLSHPLKLEGRLIGYLNHFSSHDEPFGSRQKSLIGIFASQAASTIERFERFRAFNQSLNILSGLALNLPSVPPDKFLGLVPERACALLSVPTCVVWKRDARRNTLRVAAATDDVDSEFRHIELSYHDPAINQHLVSRKTGYVADVTKSPRYFSHPGEAKARGWVSMLSAPLWAEDELVGLLDVYTHAPRHFRVWERELFEAFAGYAAVAIQRAELLQESEEILTSRERLEKLNEIMQGMTEIRSPDQLLKYVLGKCLGIAGTDRGWVSRLDDKTGKLFVVAHRGKPSGLRPQRLGEGLSGKALLHERPLRADDVLMDEFRGIYEEVWSDTRSEMAIPLIIHNAGVRVGSKIKLSSKPIGVLNLESPHVAAFSQRDVEELRPLANQAALLIERLEIDRKLTELRRIEREFFGVRDSDAIIRIVLKGITDTLGFEYVNISLVYPELNCIRTEHVIGLPEQEAEEFKRLAVYTLDSDDIQAHIVRTRKIEVPPPDDPRFDAAIYKRFGQHRLTRVFIPMIVPSDGRVIGTVEAGYQTTYRKYIYERDVQILLGFVDYAVAALEHKRSGMLERITHEFTAPIVGIRSNASFLQRRMREMPLELIEGKLDDVLVDCEILLYQVAELEYILGGRAPTYKPERTMVYRDVIIKTINQLKPIVASYGFAMSKFEYNPLDSARIILNVDRAKLCQVVYNLLINSIKYAESDPRLFCIRIEVDETKDNYIIKFKDWGIGIELGLEEKIFEDGFRAPEAIKKNVSGTGLGLTIARNIMREHGGDLILASARKPTEFHMILPKFLRKVTT